MTTIKDKLNRATKVRLMNDKPVQYTYNSRSDVSLFDMVVKRLTEALADVKSAVGDDGAMHLQKLANTMINGVSGLKLFEYNEMQICLLATGELADAPLPFNRDSVLTPREPQYIVEKYGAKDCLSHLHTAFDKLVNHEIKIYNDNREVVGLERIDPDRLN